MRRFVFLFGVLALFASGCSEEPTGDRTTQATTSPATMTTTAPDAAPDGLVVYALAETADLRGPYLVRVAREGAGEVTAAMAVEMLLLGLTFTETGHGLWTEIPSGIRAHSVVVDGAGIATIDLPAEFGTGGGTTAMLGRLAQLVASVLEVPGTEGVRLAIDGTVVDVFSSEGILLDDPMTADSIRAFLAPVTVASPAWGATVSVPFQVVGSAPETLDVGWALTDAAGRVVVDGVVPVEAGMFRIDVVPPPGTVDADTPPYQHTLIVWQDIDGGQQNAMERVLTLEP